MSTIKLKKPAGPATPAPSRGSRPPVRGVNAGLRVRPTQAEAEAYRAKRDEMRRAEASTPARAAPTVTVREGGAKPASVKRGASSRQAAPRQQTPREQTPREQAQRGQAPREPSNRPPAGRGNPFDKPRSAPRDDVRRADSPPSRSTVRERPRAEPRESFDADPPDHADGSLRLSKRMSQLGIASRREADEWIARGWVRVDGRVVSELGSRVLPGQHVTVDAKARNQQAERVTVLINKPIGYVSGQAEDGHEPAFVLVTPDAQWRADHSGRQFMREHLRSLVPAGRLDIDSTGLLVLTQDGRIAKQLIGETSEIEKEYLVRVSRLEGGGWQPSDLALLQHGLELDGEALRPAHVEWLNDDQLRFVLTQGKKRQIRRMCEAVGLHVIGLKRVRIGAVMLGDLPVGQWRYLRHDEAFGPIEAKVAKPKKGAAETDESVQVEVGAEQPDQADHDQVDRDDEVEQPRHRQDEDAGDQ